MSYGLIQFWRVTDLHTPNGTPQNEELVGRRVGPAAKDRWHGIGSCRPGTLGVGRQFQRRSPLELDPGFAYRRAERLAIGQFDGWNKRMKQVEHSDEEE